jgi:predicted TIM-barrel fold metal-dependent hydrolase
VPDFIANNEYSDVIKAKILGENAKRLYNIH